MLDDITAMISADPAKFFSELEVTDVEESSRHRGIKRTVLGSWLGERYELTSFNGGHIEVYIFEGGLTMYLGNIVEDRRPRRYRHCYFFRVAS